MILKYRVTLPSIKGFYRVYSVGSNISLYAFHKQMRSDMELPLDQLILFKALDAENKLIARYGLFDLGFGTVDNVSVGTTVSLGVASFVYFYDMVDKKSVTIVLEDKEEGNSELSPMIVDTKGPNPVEFENGYVSYEDLPEERKHPKLDDDLDFEDEEDEDLDDEDESGEDEVYDGSEDVNL